MTTDSITDEVRTELERLLDGSVKSIERQARWRPAWNALVERGDEVLPMYVRGERGSDTAAAAPLTEEFEVLKVLEAEGVPVPHIYGMISRPLSAIVMAAASGRPNLATASDDDERRSVLDQYIDVLADIHAIPVSRFTEIGLKAPTDPASSATGLLRRFVEQFRAHQSAPEPMLEFILKWVERNIPPNRHRQAFVLGDAGQFLFDSSRLTAVLDVELAHIGDPLLDLAALRLRDTAEPLGDLNRAIRRYQDRTGEAVDREVLDFHAIQFALNVPLGTSRVVRNPPPGGDPILYWEWFISNARVCIELIAERQGVELADVPVPEPCPSVNQPLYARLEESVTDLPVDDEFLSYRFGVARRISRYLGEVDKYQRVFDMEDRDEVAALLKADQRHLGDTDLEQQLTEFVTSAGPDKDSDLLQFFYRRLLRSYVLLEPVAIRTGKRRLQPLQSP